MRMVLEAIDATNGCQDRCQLGLDPIEASTDFVAQVSTAEDS